MSIDVREVARDLGFVEGPLWTNDGELLLVSVSRGIIYRLPLDGAEARIWAETGGGPNGLAQDSGGTVWVAQNGGGVMPTRSPIATGPGLQKVIPNGEVSLITRDELVAPNDLAMSPDGAAVWFTDPGHGAAPGSVWRMSIDSALLTRARESLDYPNGLAFAPDGRLAIAESHSGLIRLYRVDGDKLIDDAVLPLLSSGADGLAYARDGRLFAAIPHEDRIAVFSPEGDELPSIEFGAKTFPTNLCFAGDGRDTLIVTAAKGGRVLALEGLGVGLPL